MEKEKIVFDEIVTEGGEKIEKTPKKEPKKPAIKARIPKRKDISIDTTVENVIQWNSEGYNLFFASEINLFLELTPEEVEKLTTINKARYFTAYGGWQYNRKTANSPKPTDGIQIGTGFSTATQRLDVRGKKPGIHYCWKRPDELRQAGYDGYNVVNDENLDTFCSNPTKGIHKVGAFGDDELVLMQIPQAVFEKQQRVVRDKAKKQDEAIDVQFNRDIRKDKGLIYEPPKGAQGAGPDFNPVGSRGETDSP